MMRCLIVMVLIYLTSCGYKEYNGDILDDTLLDFTYTIHRTGEHSFFTSPEDGSRRRTGALYPDGIAYPMIITTKLELDEYLNIYKEAFDELDVVFDRLDRSPSRRPLEYYKALEKFDEDFFRYNYLVIISYWFHVLSGVGVDSIKDNGDILIALPVGGMSTGEMFFVHFVVELSNDNILEQVDVDFKVITLD